MPLTGLLNRAAFDGLLAGPYRHRNPAASGGVFYVDLDYFKALNDYAGHAAGDLALEKASPRGHYRLPAVGRRMPPASAATSSRCWVPNCDAAAGRNAGYSHSCRHPATPDLGLAATSRARLAASIGIAFVDDHNTTVADALACADDACYAAKAAGRNRFAVFYAEAASGSGGLNAARLAADMVDCHGRRKA